MAKGLFDLTGKVAVITGGNGGIGLGFARGIAKQGGDVAIWGRNPEKNAAAKAELESYGVRVSARAVDIGSEKAIVEGFEAVMAEFGRIDCTIANAIGEQPYVDSVLDLTTEDFKKFMDVSLVASFITLREGARHMVARAQAGDPGGSLIFNGSLSMFKGMPNGQAYAASKGGMGAVVRGFAVALARYGIRANSIAPGYIKTGITPDMDEKGNMIRVDRPATIHPEDDQLGPLDQMMASRTPVPRPGYARDFEAIAAYLASDGSSFHTGDTITIDGGYMVNL